MPGMAKTYKMDREILQVKYVNKCERLKNTIRFDPYLRALSHTPALPMPAPAPDAMLSNGVFHT